MVRSSSVLRGIRCFPVSGIPVRLHWSFFALLLIELLSHISHYQDFPLVVLYMLLFYGPVLYVTIVLHELGHVSACRRGTGLLCEEIVVWPLGGLTMCSAPTVAGDLWVAAAGPMVHLPQMLFWFLLYSVLPSDDVDRRFTNVLWMDLLSETFSGFLTVLSAQAFFINFIIMCFNLFVPAYPLDGGRCIANTLVLLGVSVQKSGYITSVLAMFFTVLLGLLGLFRFIFARDPSGIFIAVVVLYLFSESYQMFRMANDGSVRDHPLFKRICYDERDNYTIPAKNNTASAADDKHIDGDGGDDDDEFELDPGSAV